MKKRYQIGDKVKLSPDSEYYGDDIQGDDTIGEIVDFEYELPTNDDYIDREEYYYKVKWGNDDVNYYRYIDLMPAEEKKSLKQQAVERFGFISKDDNFTIFDEDCDRTIQEEDPANWTICSDGLYLAKHGNGGLCIYKDGQWSERTSLPKNWIVRCNDKQEDQKELIEWRNIDWCTSGWISNTKEWCPHRRSNQGIITYDQFIKWVYNPWKALESSDDSIKPGDWVIGWHHSKNELYHTPWQVEKIERVYVYPVGYSEWNTHIDNVRKQPTIAQVFPMEKEWKPKFKIGDRVQVIKASHGWGYVEHGDIGIVVYVPTRKDHSYSVNFDKCKYWTSTEECFILEEAAPKDKSAEGEFVYSPPMVRIITTNGISSEFKNEQSINLLIHKPKKVKYLKLN